MPNNKVTTINIRGVDHESTRATAKRYGVCIETIAAWRKQKLIPPGVMVGNTFYYPCDETERMVLKESR